MFIFRGRKLVKSGSRKSTFVIVKKVIDSKSLNRQMHELALKVKDIIRTEIMSDFKDKHSWLNQTLQLAMAYESPKKEKAHLTFYEK